MIARLPHHASTAHDVPLTEAERRLVELLADLALDQLEREAKPANDAPQEHDQTA